MERMRIGLVTRKSDGTHAIGLTYVTKNLSPLNGNDVDVACKSYSYSLHMALCNCYL